MKIIKYYREIIGFICDILSIFEKVFRIFDYFINIFHKYGNKFDFTDPGGLGFIVSQITLFVG